jgi:hypothetical protein
MSSLSEQQLQSATGIDKTDIQSSPAMMKSAMDPIAVHISIGKIPGLVIITSTTRLAAQCDRSTSPCHGAAVTRLKGFNL